MSDIWVIFIDTSGSMSSPFSPTKDYPGLAEKGEYNTKIEAAKDILLKQIKGLRGGEVAVIGFTGSPRLIHRGFSRNIEEFEHRIKELHAGGGTDITEALTFGSQLENIQSYQVVSFLVISDGLDNVNEQVALECINRIPSLRISTILIDYTQEGKATAEAISVRGDIKVVTSSVTLESAVSQARENHIYAVSQVVMPPNFDELREWWHDILRNFDRYKCYAMFLCLPADKEAIKYLTDYGRELDLISGKDCLVMGFSKGEFRRSGFDSRLWDNAVDEQVSQGYSLEIAKKLQIKLTDFPCVVLFDDVRSKNRETFSFKGKTADEISNQMRQIFTAIQDGIEKKEKPLTSIKKHKTLENVQRVNRSFWSKLFDFSEKTFQAAIEAWFNAVIK